MKKIGSVVLCAALAVSLLSGCSTKKASDGADVSANLQDYEFSFGSYHRVVEGSVPSPAGNGFFQIGMNNLTYFDCSTMESYVLCGKANCRHNDASCPSYFTSGNGEFGAVGLSKVGDAIYVVEKNDESNTYDLIQMDETGESQKVIHSFEIGEYQKGASMIYQVEAVYYSNTTAWMIITYKYISEEGEGFYFTKRGAELVGVSLADGSVTELLAPQNEEYTSDYELISADYVVYSKKWDEPEYLQKDAFMEELQQGLHPEFQNEEQPYLAYQTWYTQNAKCVEEIYLYDIASSSTSMIYSGDENNFYDINGSSAYPKYIFIGETFDGNILYYQLGENYDRSNGGDTNVYSWKPGEDAELLLTIPNGYPNSSIAMVDFDYSLVQHGEKFYYTCYNGDMTTKYSFDLKTGESKKLFDAELNTGFYLICELQDYYVGSFYPMDVTNDYYLIDKADYESGNFDSVVQFKI